MNTDNFARSTGRSWAQWVEFLEGIGARGMSHPQIAQAVLGTGDANGWWSQSITVAYEQHIGRRAAGQDNDGSYSVSASKTVPGDMAAVAKRWAAFVAGEVDGVAVARGPTTSATAKRHHWRAGLADGSRLVVGIEPRGTGKSAVAVAHEKLKTTGDQKRWRAYWKARLDAFAGSLS